MYLTVSFLKIPKYAKGTNLYAHYIDKSTDDETDDNFYALVTDQEPINDIEICSKIPDDLISELENYFFVINSKDGYQSSREEVIVLNTIYSHHIQEFDNDITNYIDKDFKESYERQISQKKIYYNYSFDFSQMIVNSGRLDNFDVFLSQIKSSDYYNYSYNSNQYYT